jgi:hypothetical protein
MGQQSLFVCILFITLFSLEKDLVASDIVPVNRTSFDEEIIGTGEKEVVLLEPGPAVSEAKMDSAGTFVSEEKLKSE